MERLALALVLWWWLSRRPAPATVPVVAWPVADTNSRITQEFSARHPGVDIAVPGHLRDADTHVQAVAAGVVATVKRLPRGWLVELNHGAWSSVYLHMSAVSVAVGDRLLPQDYIGVMGADPLDGEKVVHLHLQLIVGGRPVDPGPSLRALTR